MLIGQIAAKAGVNIQTLRCYERRGPLPRVRRSASGYRKYEDAMVPLVRFIKNAQELGFSSREIGELIRLRETRSRSQLKVRRVAEQKIEAIARRISQLTAMRSDLIGLVEKCKATGTNEDCVIIGAMDDGTAPACCSSSE